MCGRFTLKTPPAQWGQLLLPLLEFSAVSESWQPRYNIAPTQKVVAIVAREGQAGLVADHFRWGLVPFWAANLTVGNSMINARHETLQEKRSFKGPLEDRRCLIIADGYYEWHRRDDGSKQPYWITPRGSNAICLAGLWATNKRAKGHAINSCTIITMAANATMQRIHDRMPVVLEGQAAERWLDPRCAAEQAYGLLEPVDDDFFSAQAVSSHVNNPLHEDARCIQPLEES